MITIIRLTVDTFQSHSGSPMMNNNYHIELLNKKNKSIFKHIQKDTEQMSL